MKRALLLLLTTMALWLAACGSNDRAAPAETEAASRPQHAGEDAAGERQAGAGHEGDDHEAAGPERLALTPEQIRNAGIGLAEAGPAQIRERLVLYGVIAPNAERVREVAARFPGVIRSVRKRVGDPAKQGETLASVESNESLQTYTVVAPLAGVVTARRANPGEQTGEEALFTVADLSTVWVELSLFPRDLGKVRVGQSVRVKSAEANRSGEGHIVYVAPFGSASNQTLTARVLLDNAERQWPPGLYVTAEVTLANVATPLAVSSDALQTLEERPVIFVQDENGFEPRSVQLGRSDGEFTEVLAGLQPGEIYATRNSFILKAELAKGDAEHAH